MSDSGPTLSETVQFPVPNSFWRGCAFLIDGIYLSVVFVAAGWLTTSSLKLWNVLTLWDIGILSASVCLFQIIPLLIYSATPGKKKLKLKVTTKENEEIGRYPLLAVARGGAVALLTVTGLMILVSATAFFRTDRRHVLDLLLGTKVVDDGDGSNSQLKSSILFLVVVGVVGVIFLRHRIKKIQQYEVAAVSWKGIRFSQSKKFLGLVDYKVKEEGLFQLEKAIDQNNISKVRKLVQSALHCGFPLEGKAFTLLLIKTLEEKNFVVADIFFNAGVSPNMMRDSFSLLDWTLISPRVSPELLSYLLRRGAVTSEKSAYFSGMSGKLSLVQVIVSSIELSGGDRQKALNDALVGVTTLNSENSNIKREFPQKVDELVTWLLSSGASVEARAILAGRPLGNAVRAGDLALVDLLLKSGADPTAPQDNDGRTPLELAEKYIRDQMRKNQIKSSLSRAIEMKNKPMAIKQHPLPPARTSKLVIIPSNKATPFKHKIKVSPPQKTKSSKLKK